MSFSMSGFQAATSSTFAVGDIENNFKKLTRLLLKVHYSTLFARERVLAGESAVFVPMLRYALSAMSHKLTRHLLNHGYEIYATSDAKFIECVYKVCIHAFHYYPVLTQLQFLNPPKGYAERKIVLVTSVIQCCLTKHQELVRDLKADSVRSTSSKKKQREAVQARLTQAAHKSAELVRAEVVGYEGQPQQQQGRGRRASRDESSFSSSRSASTSARARSVSKTRVPLSASRKKSTPYATRPSTAHAASSNGFASSNASNASFFRPNASQQGGVAIEHMAENAVERSMQPNGELVEVDIGQLMERAAQRAQQEGEQRMSPVKKASVLTDTRGDMDRTCMRC
jgi:hypothetical protein